MKTRDESRRRLPIAVFVSIFLIGLVPILFLSASFYYKTYEDAVDAVDDFQRSYLSQLSALAEEYLYSVINAANELTTRPSILEYESHSDIPYIESITGPYSQATLVDLYNYLDVKSRALGELAAFKRNDRFVLLVEYLHEASDTVLTSGPHSYRMAEGAHSIPWYDWYDSVYDHGNSIAVFPVPKAQSGMLNRHLLVATTRTVSGPRKVTVAVTIDQTALLGSLVSRLPPFPQPGTLSIHSAGELVYAYQPETGIPYLDSHSGDFATVSRHIALTDWLISLSVSRAEFRADLAGVRVIIALSASLVALVTGASLLLSARISAPLTRLADKLGVRSRSSITTALKTGVESIEDGVIALINEQQSLQRTVQAGMPTYRENYLRGLVSGDVLDTESLEAQFDFLEIDLDTTDFLVMTLSFVHGSLPDDPGDRRAAIEQTKLLAAAMFHGRVRAVQFELQNERITILANATNRTLEPVIEIVTSIQSALSERHGIRAYIGVGYPHPRAERIRASYEEAEEARIHASLSPSGAGGVLFVGDIRLIRTEPTQYPADIEQEVFALVMTGNGEGAIRAFDRLVDEMRVQSLSVGRYRIHHAILRTMNLVYEKRADVRPGYQIPADEYAILMRCMEEGREDEAIELVHEAIVELAASIAGSRQEKELILADQVRRLIERDYRTLTLTRVGDELSVSPSVVSRIFKQVNGVGFSDCLTEYRLAKGVELLKTSNLSIGEITREVGYSNSNYFIRLFKQSTGTTPGEYRRCIVEHRS